MASPAEELAEIFQAPDSALTANQVHELARQRVRGFLGWLATVPTNGVRTEGFVLPSAESFFAIYSVGEEGAPGGIWNFSIQGDIEQSQDGLADPIVSQVRGITVRQGSNVSDGHVLNVQARGNA